MQDNIGQSEQMNLYILKVLRLILAVKQVEKIA